MKRILILVIFFLALPKPGNSQPALDEVHSDFVLYHQRVSLYKDLRDRIIGINFVQRPDTNTEYRFQSACEAIAQFLLSGAAVETGFNHLFDFYDTLQPETRLSFLEAVYAVYPDKYVPQIRDLLSRENDPRLFSVCAAYLFRNNGSSNNSAYLRTRMARKFPGYDTIPVLAALDEFLHYHHNWSLGKTPDLVQLFHYQKKSRQKIIYSFQRWNRNFPGLAIVQMEDGHFARMPNGKLQAFEQLARSGPDLPYFITNGNTPQGIFSIQGIAVSRNSFIGPTPNIQLIMPFESGWTKFFSGDSASAADSLNRYLQLLPAGWRNYAPMMESWQAGKIGRTEIIAHGTALDPEYFRGKAFYPLTPTQGCLCAKEIWNTNTGRLQQSDQYDLVSCFLSSPPTTGFLLVINLDDQQKPVSRAELEHWVNAFESRR